MKCSLTSLLVLFVAATAHAGSFGGPPPFSNGSPLVTGVDGSYQASARATNVTGIFRFQYSSGAQTATANVNNWVFFINGQVQRGSVVANINDNNLDGILDALAGSTTTNSNGTITLPVIFLNANNSSSGSFKGQMSANGDFKGSGKISPLPAATNQIIAISQTGTNSDIVAGGVIQITNATFTNAASSIPETSFKFRGVRSSTGTTVAASTATTN